MLLLDLLVSDRGLWGQDEVPGQKGGKVLLDGSWRREREHHLGRLVSGMNGWMGSQNAVYLVVSSRCSK